MADRRFVGARGATFALPLLWMTLFLAIPFLLIGRISLSESVLAQPPYAPTFAPDDGLPGWLDKLTRLSTAAFTQIFDDGLYLPAYLNSLRLATISTLAALALAYPFALAIARVSPRWRNGLLLLAVAPFWTSFLIRVYAWIVLIKDEGLINMALLRLGVVDEPLRIFATDAAIVIGIVYSYFPFMVLPLYAALERQDRDLIEAAQDLGATPFAAFRAVTLPLSLPGVYAGSLLVFIPAVGEFVIPDLLGGSDSLMIGRVLWNEFFSNRDWPAASAGAIVLLALLAPALLLHERRRRAT